jgi:hypothetical protein
MSDGRWHASVPSIIVMPSSLRKAKVLAENGNWSATVLRERTDHGGATVLLTGCGENEPLVISVPLSSASSNHDIVLTNEAHNRPIDRYD